VTVSPIGKVVTGGVGREDEDVVQP